MRADADGSAERPGARGGRRDAAVLALLAGAVLAAFAELVPGDHVPVYRDLLTVVLPFRELLAEHLRRGELPLWNPFLLLGTPFLAALHGGALYPPSLLLLLPTPLGFDWLLLFHYLAALAGTWVWLRGRGGSRGAAAAGALTFVLGGYLVSMANMTTHLEAAAWTPWAFVAWSRHRARPGARAAAALVALLSLQLLAGSIETLAMTVLVLAGWTVADARGGAARCARELVILGAAAAAVAIVTAAQILPTIEYLGQSDRATSLSLDEVGFWSLEPRALAQLLFPRTPALAPDVMPGTFGPPLGGRPGWIASLYLGLVPLCLAIAGAAAGRERLFWSACLFAGAALALGVNAPFFPLLHDVLPGVVARFRYPEKFWFLTHLAAAVLAAEGAERLARGSARALLLPTFAVLALVALPWLAAAAGHGTDAARLLHGGELPEAFAPLFAADLAGKSGRGILVLGAFAAILAAGAAGRIDGARVTALAAVLVALDLVSAHRDLNLAVRWSELTARPLVFDAEHLRRSGMRVFHYQTELAVPTRLGERTAIPGLDQWQRPFGPVTDLRGFAVEHWRVAFLDLGMLHGFGTAGGFDGITRASDVMLRRVLAAAPRERAIALLGTFSVDTLVGPAALDSGSLVRLAAGPPWVYRIPAALPPVYAVTRLRTAASPEDALRALVDGEVRPGLDAAVESLPEGWADSGATALVESVEREPAALRAVVRAEAPALVVVNESWFPGWHAGVDGEPAEIRRVNGLVRGVVVPAGEHRVEMRYRPASFRLGAAVSLAGLAALLGAAVLGGRASGNRGR